MEQVVKDIIKIINKHQIQSDSYDCEELEADLLELLQKSKVEDRFLDVKLHTRLDGIRPSQRIKKDSFEDVKKVIERMNNYIINLNRDWKKDYFTKKHLEINIKKLKHGKLIRIKKEEWAGDYRLEYDGKYITLLGKDKRYKQFKFDQGEPDSYDEMVLLSVVKEVRNAKPSIVKQTEDNIYISLQSL